MLGLLIIIAFILLAPSLARHQAAESDENIYKLTHNSYLRNKPTDSKSMQVAVALVGRYLY